MDVQWFDRPGGDAGPRRGDRSRRGPRRAAAGPRFGARHARGSRRLLTRGSAVLAALGLLGSSLVASSLTMAPQDAVAAPGSPGVPGASQVLFAEDFENRPANSNVLLTDYVGASGTTYTGDPFWVGRTNCNGIILDHGSPRATGDCTGPGGTEATGIGTYDTLAALPYALGALVGHAAPASNAAAASFTSGSSADDQVQFRTATPLELPASDGRFVTFSVDAVAVNCHATHPELRFYLVDESGTEIPVSSTAIDPCTDSRASTVAVPRPSNGSTVEASGGRFAADSSQLVTGSTLGVVLRNENGNGGGNDGAYDNIRVLDVTPQLDKEFSPTVVSPGRASTLTFTVTNTEELAAKNGWSFTDALPAGLVVATPNAVATTCPAGSVTAAAGSSTITASGNLSAGMTSCTITVGVTGFNAGSYTNGPDNITSTGLNEPGEATLDVVPPLVTCTSDADIFNTGYDAATGGTLPDNAKDANWQVAGPYPASATVSAPPADATWGAANVGKIVANWADSPYGNAQWISQQTIAAPNQGVTFGDWYYRFQFDLDAGVDPGSFALAMNFLADNAVAEVFVNGEPQSGKTTGLPQTPLTAPATNPGTYYYAGFFTANAAQTTLADDWRTGLNTIVVQVKSAAPMEGFDAQVRPSVLCPQPALTVAKTADLTEVSTVGETVTYSFDVTNTGNVPLTDVVVDDTDFSGSGELTALACPADTTLDPGESLTCTASYAVTQADLDSGTLSNTATATGTPPTGDPVDSPPSTVDVPVDPQPALTVAKTADLEQLTEPGQTVTYSFVVANTGNVTIVDPQVTETAFSGSGPTPVAVCPAGPVAPGASVTCEATYVVTQEDLDAGTLANTATATGTTPSGDPVPPSDPSTVEVPVDPRPSLEIVKDADLTDPAAFVVGQEVTYFFDVVNTGNVTLTDVSVDEDSFTGDGTMSAIQCPADGVASLAPGERVTCEATYVLEQGDVDAGSVTNTASASGTSPAGDPVPSDPSTVRIPADPRPELEVVKTADLTEITAAGQTVTYSFEVTNTGNVTITDPQVTETAFSGTGEPPVISCPAGQLAPRDAVTCEATYVVTQADVDSGELSNTATATGTPPGDTPPPMSPPSTVDVPVDPQPGLEVVKTADLTEITAAGQTVTYSFEVTNTGNVTITDPQVTETEFSGTGEPPVATCPVGPLAPGVSVTCEATYVVTQADVDSGELLNTATATGTPPGDTPPPMSPPSTVDVPVDPQPGLEVVKTADLTEITAAGQTVTYSFEVTNTGNVTITDPQVTETEFSGTGEPPVATCPVGPLAPGVSVTCEATYVVTQADVDSGELSNTATATGTPPGDTPPPMSPPSTVDVPVDPQPGITVVKSADLFDPAQYQVGRTVTYSFVVTNTGNVTLRDVVVDDSDFSGAGALSPLACPADGLATLVPGAQVVCEATYVLTQADVDAGEIVNTAVATGTPPPGLGTPPVSPPSTVEVPAAPEPGLSLVKTADPASMTRAGQEVTYTFVVTNTGNTTLTDVVIDETEFSGSGELPAIDCPAEGVAALLPGQVVSCTVTYVTTQADVDSGLLSNTATATGTPPGNVPPPVSPPSTAEVPFTGTSSLELDKTATTVDVNGNGTVDVGDRIEWSIVVTNTGATTVEDIAVSDPTAGKVTCPATSLAPGESMDCTVPARAITAEDGARGHIHNEAGVTGNTPWGDPVEPASDEVTTSVEPAPAGPAKRGGPLATTGATIGWIAGGAALLVLIGVVALIAARNRRTIP
ncbi:DUF7507 domain-containing protein [Cellulosimicrobium cellulans]|uniref:DUF7507 domain-containing protein n=1 Tax=Cellulosimicrobium cellulans TaxID=1710 RepID=UPI000848BA72|nr:DUF11 domain-containing protein [Cellulosimicrobium cellulans]